MSDRERPKLRLVTSELGGKTEAPGAAGEMQRVTDDLDDVLEDVGDDFYAGEGLAPKAKPAKPPRSKEKFAMVPLRWLMDRRWDNIFPARTRLYLYLQFRSHRGTQEMRLTNKETTKLGLTKQYKMRCLRQLAADGLVSVVSTDNETVRVSVSRHRPRTK